MDEEESKNKNEIKIDTSRTWLQFIQNVDHKSLAFHGSKAHTKMKLKTKEGEENRKPQQSKKSKNEDKKSKRVCGGCPLQSLAHTNTLVSL